jgi:2',3'-cyclic-nucleotide 2'-phosphodiesterase / 3'-nucleotidase / 5'-nucleotidase
MIERALLIVATILAGLLAQIPHQPAHARDNKELELKLLGRYQSGIFGPDRSAAESLAHDPGTQRLFVVNVADKTIDVIDISDPNLPFKLLSVDLTPFGSHANSIAVHDGIVAAAVEATIPTDPGKAVFFNANGQFFSAVTVGVLPDMITFTTNGQKVLVANEGQPSQDYTVDPEGSVSIIDMRPGASNVTQDDVTTADFTAFNNVPLDPRIRIFGPNATVAQDLEPEYIAVSQDSKTAWVTLQENNAIAKLDIERGKFTKLFALGFKDHQLPRNGLDASDEDNTIKIAEWPVKGMYQPDGIASYRYGRDTFLVTANEGDARDYDGFAEEARVNDLNLDPVAFPDGDKLKQDTKLGRLTVTTATGDKNKDGIFEELYAFGARSFSIWDEHGKLVFDSGNDFEKIIAKRFPDFFNSDNGENNFDNRSDNKGPEPEDVTMVKIFGRVYAFIGLERIGGIMIYDVTNPYDVSFVDYFNSRDFTVPTCLDVDEEEGCNQDDETNPDAGDLGPEIIHFIAADDSPNGKPLLAVSHEISGTTTLYEIVSGHKFKPNGRKRL